MKFWKERLARRNCRCWSTRKRMERAARGEVETSLGSRPIYSIHEVNQRFNKWSFLLWGWIEPSSIASIFRKRESRPRPTDRLGTTDSWWRPRGTNRSNRTGTRHFYSSDLPPPILTNSPLPLEKTRVGRFSSRVPQILSVSSIVPLKLKRGETRRDSRVSSNFQIDGKNPSHFYSSFVASF